MNDKIFNRHSVFASSCAISKAVIEGHDVIQFNMNPYVFTQGQHLAICMTILNMHVSIPNLDFVKEYLLACVE